MHCNAAKDFSESLSIYLIWVWPHIYNVLFLSLERSSRCNSECVSVCLAQTQSVSGLNALLCCLLFWSVGAWNTLTCWVIFYWCEHQIYDLPDSGHLSKLKVERRAQITCVKEDWQWLLMSSWWWMVKVCDIGWPQAPGPCSEPSVKCGMLRPVSLSAPRQHTVYCVSVTGTGLTSSSVLMIQSPPAPLRHNLSLLNRQI